MPKVAWSLVVGISFLFPSLTLAQSSEAIEKACKTVVETIAEIDRSLVREIQTESTKLPRELLSLINDAFKLHGVIEGLRENPTVSKEIDVLTGKKPRDLSDFKNAVRFFERRGGTILSPSVRERVESPEIDLDRLLRSLLEKKLEKDSTANRLEKFEVRFDHERGDISGSQQIVIDEIAYEVEIFSESKRVKVTAKPVGAPVKLASGTIPGVLHYFEDFDFEFDEVNGILMGVASVDNSKKGSPDWGIWEKSPHRKTLNRLVALGFDLEDTRFTLSSCLGQTAAHADNRVVVSDRDFKWIHQFVGHRDTNQMQCSGGDACILKAD